MNNDVRFARQLERAILAAVAEDRAEQLDLPGMIDDLATTYADIVVRLRRVQERLAPAGGQPVEHDYLILPRAQRAPAPIKERMPQ